MNIRNIIEEDLIKFNNKDYIFEKKNNKYIPIKFNDFINKAKALSSYLIAKGLLNEKILIIGKNSINYMIADLSVTIYTGICVNINRDTKEEDLDYLINYLDIKAIIFTNEQNDKINLLKSNIIKINIDNIIDKLDKIDNKYKKYNEEECSKIVFSSGTTSKSKGIKLSIKNMFAGWNSLYKRIDLNIFDVVYLFLPLHHTYANIYNFYYSLISGLTLYISSGVNNIIEELKEVNPTVFCAVPLIYERIYEYYKGKIKDAFGNRNRRLFAGGAKLDVNLKKMYRINNLNLLDTYALTETASSFAVEYLKDEIDDSVGTLYEDMQFKVIDINNGIGEICVKGDALFLGYTTNIKNIYTQDGYFKTGDLGYIKDNKLYIKGRKKKVLIGSNGENIYIDEIVENLKKLDTNINHVIVNLVNNKISVIIYLNDRSKSDITKIINIYNSKCIQKNKIYEYKVEDKFQKLM